MHVMVPEQRGLPAAKAVERHRYGDRNVDPDHSDLDLVRVVARGITVASKDGSAIGVSVRVYDLDCRLIVSCPDDREHRPEYFFLPYLHLGGDAVEQRTSQEEAVLKALHLEAAAIDHEPGALAFTVIDVPLDL